jgi:hypothetical protein
VAFKPRRISEIKSLISHLAQTSHYQVEFGSLPRQLKSYLNSKGIDDRFISESAGLLCYSALLPTTSLGSFTVDGNYMGIQEKFANARLYDQITLDFYVDKDYKMLNFIEYWMEFISSGSYYNSENPPISPNRDSYFIRMQYPEFYKANSTKIVKFDRDYKKEIEYNFRGFFPINISSLPVSYTNTDTLKMSVSFSYERYIAGKTNSVNQVVSRDSNNQDPLGSLVGTDLNRAYEASRLSGTGSEYQSSQPPLPY